MSDIMSDIVSAMQLYPAEDIQKGKLELLSQTSMLDSAIEVFQALYPGQEVGEGQSYPLLR